MIFRVAYWCSLVSTPDCPLPPPVTGGVCLATRVRYRQSCGLDTWSVLFAYLFVSRICLAGLCFCSCSCFYFFPSPPIRSGEAFSSVIFSLFLFFYLFFGCSDGIKRKVLQIASKTWNHGKLKGTKARSPLSRVEIALSVPRTA